MSNRLLVLSFIGLLAASSAFAAGFEKSVMWSGKYSGRVNAAAADVVGAESLYFNPAGLASGAPGSSVVSLNFSPTVSQFKGPEAYIGSETTGSSKFSPIFGALVQHSVNEQFGFGLGAYVSAGSTAEFKDLDYSSLGFALQPTEKTDIRVLEAVLGAGYAVTPNLKLGAEWRVAFVAAKFAAITYATTPAPNLVNAGSEDLSATKWNGFRLGAQYAADSKDWGLGLSFRSNLDFVAKGKASGTYNVPALGANGALTGSDMTIHNSLPEQIALGAFVKVSPTWTIFPQYEFTHYSRNRQLDLTGTITLPNPGLTRDLSASPIHQSWKNMHTFRLGSEWMQDDTLVLRAGAEMNNAVTPKDHARSTFSSPGNGYTLDIGAGKKLTPTTELNGGLEYAWAGGSGANAEQGLTADHDYNSHAYALHAGVNIAF